jgi:hypothetical protein
MKYSSRLDIESGASYPFLNPKKVLIKILTSKVKGFPYQFDHLYMILLLRPLQKRIQICMAGYSTFLIPGF